MKIKYLEQKELLVFSERKKQLLLSKKPGFLGWGRAEISLLFKWVNSFDEDDEERPHQSHCLCQMPSARLIQEARKPFCAISLQRVATDHPRTKSLAWSELSPLGGGGSLDASSGAGDAMCVC